MTTLDFDVAIENYKARRHEHWGKQIDNGKLVAGSPMYFYCRFCGIPTDTLPECYTSAPVTLCRPCEVLYDHGVLPYKPPPPPETPATDDEDIEKSMADVRPKLCLTTWKTSFSSRTRSPSNR